MKNAPDPSKSCMGNKQCHMRQEYLQAIEKIKIQMNKYNFKVHQTCTGTKKKHVLNFKVHQTCTGTKKTKVLNFKARKTCTGTKNKKNKNFRGIVAPSQVDCEVFVFFCPCAGFVHFEVQNFCFFCPCAGFVNFTA